MPNSLIERVDVVTGGASAVYGSDALAGVVNFVLDRDFTGVKGSVQGGITTYGDAETYKVDVTAGTPFASGRGHFMVSGEHAYAAPIDHAYYRKNIADNAWNWVANPAYGTGAGQTTSVPQYIALDHVGLATATPGGLITSGPLKGTVFLEGGRPAQFNYGTIIGAPYMQGGDWQSSRLNGQLPLDLEMQRESIFTRASYDLADNVTVFAEAQWAHAFTDNEQGVNYFRLGNITIRNDNAFIPQSIRTQMTALNLTSFSLGTWNGDFIGMGAENTRYFRRYMAGAEGAFDAADTTWSWEFSVSRSTTHISARSTNNYYIARYLEATDAVYDSAGRIVCRSTLTNPTNGCIPINVMGIGVNNPKPGSYPYSNFNGYLFTRMALNTVAGQVTGEPLDTWAGPVSVALSAEYRKESATGFASSFDEAGVFFAGNYKGTSGAYSVKEAAFETVIPLARDEDWARSFDLNAAIRATDYSQSGYVTTWKVGATYSPVDDLTFRATRSRDIRAPNIGDLFSGGASGTGNITDRFRNNEAYTTVTVTQGNPALLPEKADTTGVGVVLQPTFLPGFGASVDYYNIDIKGALATLSNQELIDRCFAGEAELCTYFVREGGSATGLITRVNNRPRNLISQQARGIDFEASYNFPLSTIDADLDGSLNLRGMATKVLRLNSTDQNGVKQEGAGVGGSVQGGAPLTTEDFRYIVSLTYTNEPFSGTITMRGVGATVYSRTAVVCTTGCPVSSTLAPTFSMNHIDGDRKFDLSMNYKFDNGITTFFIVDNVFNDYLPVKYGTVGAGLYQNINGDDGRTFRAGIRFQM
ncbi:MAG: TonB-dependent receptor [Proteobacteria bacterium]|nr:TonB-dependent receptor [Pseudomonadota bacterium]